MRRSTLTPYPHYVMFTLSVVFLHDKRIWVINRTSLPDIDATDTSRPGPHSRNSPAISPLPGDSQQHLFSQR
jgi:hypothetical protein